MLWAIDKRRRHFHGFVLACGLDSASGGDAPSSVAVSGNSEGYGLPATWGYAPSSSGIISDLFGIAPPIAKVICEALRTEQPADIGGMSGCRQEVGEIANPGRKVHGAVGGPVEAALDSRLAVVAGEGCSCATARRGAAARGAPGAGSALGRPQRQRRWRPRRRIGRRPASREARVCGRRWRCRRAAPRQAATRCRGEGSGQENSDDCRRLAPSRLLNPQLTTRIRVLP